MSRAHETRVARHFGRESTAALAPAVARVAGKIVRGPRSDVPPLPAAPSRTAVRRWMRHAVTEYDCETALVEGCAAALPIPEAWLDDETHWIWDLAFVACERAA